MPFNSSVVFVPSPILHQKYLPLHHNTSGPGRKYMCFLPSFISVSTFFPPSMCAESSYTNVMQQNSDVSVCPAVIVLSVHILKDIVLNGAACCWLGCMSILNRAFKFLMIIEIISEHPSGTWDCCLGPFYSSCYHIRLIFVCIEHL